MRDENVVKCGRLKAQTVVKAVNTRNMHGYYAETKEERKFSTGRFRGVP